MYFRGQHYKHTLFVNIDTQKMQEKYQETHQHVHLLKKTRQ